MAAHKLTATASLLHNNLTMSASGYIACIHNSQNPGGGKILIHAGGQSRDGPEVTQGTTIRFLNLASGQVLCVCSHSGTQIYTEDASALLFFAAAADGGERPEMLKHHQGACVEPNLQHVVIGTSAGGLVVVGTGTSFVALAELPPPSPATSVADLCYGASAGCAAGSIVTAHDDGELRIWTPADTGHYINSNVAPSAGEAPVRISPLGSRLLVAYATGHLRIFDGAALELQVEITAHARCLTAIDLREDFGQIATVGEDTALNVWLVDPANLEVSLQHTSVVAAKLLTGVVLTNTGAAVCAYDSDDLCTVNF